MRWFKRRGDERTPPTAEELRDERLSRYLDDDLAAEERSALEAQLAADAGVREALEGMREIRDALAALGEVPAPRAFTLTAVAVREPPRLPWLETATRIATGVAALLFVAALVNPMGNGESNVAEDAAAEPGIALFSAPTDAAPDASPEPGAGAAIQAPEPPENAGGGVEEGVESGSGGAAEGARTTGEGEDGDTLGTARPVPDEEFSGSFGPEPGQAFPSGGSGPGGVVPGLAVLVVLLGALSALLRWDERARDRAGE